MSFSFQAFGLYSDLSRSSSDAAAFAAARKAFMQMTSIERPLPEPSLPEHELIRSAAPLPELSSGFRDRVLAECSRAATRTRWLYRVQLASLAAAVCGLAWLTTAVELSPPTSSETPSVTAGQSSAASEWYSGSPGVARQSPMPPPGDSSMPGAENLSVAEPMPQRTDPGNDMQQLNDLMESLRNREQLFEANFFGL